MQAMEGHWDGLQTSVSSSTDFHDMKYLLAPEPAAQFIATIVSNAGSPKQFRGFSTNVANYNGWNLSPGEFECSDDSACNPAQNEKKYVSLFAAGLAKSGVSNYAIVDTSRNAVQGLRLEWGDWCNVNGAGLGVRPTSNTSDSQTDAFVWVKAVGESDGTSDPYDPEYNSYCGKADGLWSLLELFTPLTVPAFKPSPSRGVWNQAYFNMLLTNAVPVI
jgi:cellulose 1,4-beta-cellobiosidase